MCEKCDAPTDVIDNIAIYNNGMKPIRVVVIVVSVWPGDVASD